MVVGYSSNAFVNMDLETSLAKIAALGFSGVEIMCDRPHLYPPDYDNAQLLAVRDQLVRHGLCLTNLNSFTLFAVGDTHLPSWIETEAERRLVRIQHTQQCLRIASTLGCANISIPPGGPPSGQSRKEAMDLFYRGLEAVIPVAEELGVGLLVEPEPDLLIERTAEFQEFIRDIGAIGSSLVGLNFDIGHFYCAGEDPADAFESLFEWVGHVHVDDIGQSRLHHHLVPGDGAIDFARVFARMKQLGYTGGISLELYTYADMPEAAGRAGLDYLRPLLAEAGIGSG